MSQYADQDFVDMVVKAIVNHPNDVKTVREIDDRGVKITLSINPEDMGYVIGKGGQTARSIRTLLRIVGAKTNARVSLLINEPEGGRRSRANDDMDTSVVDDLKI